MTNSIADTSSEDRITSHVTNERQTKLVHDLNMQIAQLRDSLICIGGQHDGPELRERIRKIRRHCIGNVKHASSLILPLIKGDIAEGIPADNQNFVHLVSCTQLLIRELIKSKRLIIAMPMDMTQYYENKPGFSGGMGGLGLISQLLLCRQLHPDFQHEELNSINRDLQEITAILDDMQEYMPKAGNDVRNLALTGEDVFSLWSKKRSRRSLYKKIGFCCACKPAHL